MELQGPAVAPWEESTRAPERSTFASIPAASAKRAAETIESITKARKVEPGEFGGIEFSE